MQTQDILLTIFTGILAIAVLMQTLIFVGIFLAIRRLAEQVDRLSRDVMKNVEVVTAKTDETLAVIRDIGNGLVPVKDKIVNAAEVVHQRVVKMDEFLEETTETARSEILRVRNGFESAADRLEEMLQQMQDCVMTPVNEINAVVRGVRAGFDLLFRKRRRPAVDPDQDEEMFI
jgi:methyl-accepting chemotaxis protein